MEDIGAGSVLLRTENYDCWIPKDSAFIVEHLIVEGQVTFVKLKGMDGRQFLLDNFTPSKNHKKDLKRAYQFLIKKHEFEIDKLKGEIQSINDPPLFTEKNIIDSGNDIKVKLQKWNY